MCNLRLHTLAVIFFLSAIGIVSAGCGKKGPLYLPETPVKQEGKQQNEKPEKTSKKVDDYSNIK